MVFSRQSAIVGIAQTPLAKASEDSALELALKACLGALEDAGIDPHEVDGLVRFGAPFETVSHAELARLLGVDELAFFGEIPLGGEASAGMVSHAAAAIASGQASVVLAFRSIKQSGGNRFGRADQAMGRVAGEGEEDLFVGGDQAFQWPYGMMAPTHLFALWATRYLHVAGIAYEQLNEALGTIALAQRAYAKRHPGALMGGRPLEREGFREARMISWPLSLFTICLENDGACAVVLTSAERAASLREDPAYVLAASQSLAPRREPMSVYAPDLIEIFPPSVPSRLWAQAGIGPSDIDVAELYDATSLMTILSLELYGFAARGEGWRYVLENGIGPDSPLPVNTHGGHLSDGYVQGMTGLLEAVRQIRHSADNQVPDVEFALYGAPSGSAVVLGRA